MNGGAAGQDAVAEPSPRRGLRWWQWLAFFLPGIVTVATAWVLVADVRARDEASGFTLLSDYGRSHIWFGPGITGFTTGAVGCVICGIILGVTTRQRHRVFPCIGWILLSVLTNLPLAFAGCILVAGITRP